MTDNILRNTAVTMIAVTTLLAGISVMSDGVDAANARCGNHKDVVAFLGKKYKETRIGMGLINAGQMMELYMSEQGSWTVLITRPDGVSCFGPVGKNWMHIKAKPAKTETGA
ncbi:MAG: hypothetical protein AAF299_04940 [Pseudomonadota bacterium]